MNQSDYAPSPCLPVIKKFAYFLSLSNIPKNLWTLIRGTPFYLSNWWMRYSRMTWHLLILAKYLGFILQIKIQIACSLNDIQIPTKAIYDHTWQNFPHICLLLCVEFGQVLWPLLRDFSCSQDQNSRTHHIKHSYIGNTLKHVSITSK